MMDETYEVRLSALERWRTTVEVSLGKQDLDREYINKRFDRIENDLKEMKNAAKNLNYTIYGFLILAFLKFALSGGLASVGL